MRLAFCTAWPAAPFVRLSIAAVTSSVGARTPATGSAATRTTLRWRTSRSVGIGSPGPATSTNGSPAYASRQSAAGSAAYSAGSPADRDGDRREDPARRRQQVGREHEVDVGAERAERGAHLGEVAVRVRRAVGRP
jgi:hypothetical protein